MANLLLLYDTKEEDLAKDFKDLLVELNVGNIVMIPLAPNKELSLEEKERKNFASANGAIFIITPGSERDGVSYPSPSVNVEIGKAIEQFKDKPECVILLVDDKCKTPIIIQKPHIPFKRDSIRSILSALIKLTKDLKSAGLFRTTPIPTQAKQPNKQFDVNAFVKNLNSINTKIIPVLFDMSNENSGAIFDRALTELLVYKYKLNTQQINFLKRDLGSFGVALNNAGSWWLTNLGWDIVRFEVDRKNRADREAMNNLSKYLKPPTSRENY